MNVSQLPFSSQKFLLIDSAEFSGKLGKHHFAPGQVQSRGKIRFTNFLSAQKSSIQFRQYFKKHLFIQKMLINNFGKELCIFPDNRERLENTPEIFNKIFHCF